MRVFARRRLLRAALSVPALALLAACAGAPPTPTARPPAPLPTAVPTAVQPTAAAAATQPAAALPPATAPAATSAPPTAVVPAAQPANATSGPAATMAPPTALPPTATAAKPAAAITAPTLPPTPACADADDLTVAQTEGPYFTPNTPERASLLEASVSGTRLTLTGRVVSTRCQPVQRALLDFWQADDKGEYDNRGFKLRGHQFTDAQGNFKLETIVPGLYPGRTRHIHVKVQAPNRPVLTSQLYFPAEAGNARDGIFNPKLTMKVQDGPGGAKLASFEFVLAV